MFEQVGISEAAKMFGITPATLRKWEEDRIFSPTSFTKGGQRRYSVAAILTFLQEQNCEKRHKSIRAGCYARVTTYQQRKDLERQVKRLRAYCQKQDYQIYQIYKDIGPGAANHKKGLLQLFRDVIARKLDRVIFTYSDRFTRLSLEFIEPLLIAHGVLLETIAFELTTFAVSEITLPDMGSPQMNDIFSDLMVLASQITTFSGRFHSLRRGVELPDQLQEDFCTPPNYTGL